VTSAFPTAEERDALRSGIARTHAENRETLDAAYIADKKALEDQYHSDVQANEQALREAYVAAGLNPDGTDPLGRPQGSAV